MAKRIQFSAYGNPDVLEYVNFTPADPAADEVQVKNVAIGVNYIDIYIRQGLYPVPGFPSGIGFEASGIVTKVGADVTYFKEGDRVVYAQAALGAYSEIHNVLAAQLTHLPDEISFEQAAASFLKGLTVQYLLRQTYIIKPDEIFLFHAAAGGVGLIACQWAKALGAKMIGTVSSAEKAEQAKQAGAWETIDYTKEDVVQRVAELTKGKKVNVVYDSVGRDTWLTSLDCLRPRGLMVSFGNASGPVTDVNLGILNQKGSLFVTRPSLGGYIRSYQELKQASHDFFELVTQGVIKVDVPEQQKFPLQQAAQLHQQLQSRQTTGSCLLIP